MDVLAINVELGIPHSYGFDFRCVIDGIFVLSFCHFSGVRLSMLWQISGLSRCDGRIHEAERGPGVFREIFLDIYFNLTSLRYDWNLAAATIND